MLTRADLREKQKIIVREIMSHNGRLIVSKMGSGKTGATLTAIVDLLAAGEIKHVLVIAPLRVATDTWPDEILEWEHTSHLTFAVACGEEPERAAAIRQNAQVTIINRENLVWLAKFIGKPSNWIWDCVIVDESSMFKAGKKKTTRAKVKTRRIRWQPAYREEKICEYLVFPNRKECVRFTHDRIGTLLGSMSRLGVTKNGQITQQIVRKGGNITRFGVLSKVRKHIRRIYLLTGTPTPNGVIDLWGQLYLIDQGERLCRSYSAFERKWFDKNQYSHEIKAKDGAETEITRLAAEVMVSIPPDKLVDDPVYVPVWVDLPPKIMKEYKEFEKTLFSQPYDVEAVTQGVLVNKLLQFSNGSLYREDGSAVFVHDQKLRALDAILEEAVGENVLIFYGFNFDLQAIRKRYPEAVVLNESKTAVKDWNAGKIKYLLAHPASCAHGLNMQYGGHISVWFGLNWSLELWEQANARLPRPGQKHTVASYMLMARDTYDEKQLSDLQAKDVTQSRIVESVRLRMANY